MRPHPDKPTGEPVFRIGGEDATIPAWYTYDAASRGFTCRVQLDDEERAAIAAGADIALTLYGGELPWSLTTHRS